MLSRRLGGRACVCPDGRLRVFRFGERDRTSITGMSQNPSAKKAKKAVLHVQLWNCARAGLAKISRSPEIGDAEANRRRAKAHEAWFYYYLTGMIGILLVIYGLSARPRPTRPCTATNRLRLYKDHAALPFIHQDEFGEHQFFRRARVPVGVHRSRFDEQVVAGLQHDRLFSLVLHSHGPLQDVKEHLACMIVLADPRARLVGDSRYNGQLSRSAERAPRRNSENSKANSRNQ